VAGVQAKLPWVVSLDLFVCGRFSLLLRPQGGSPEKSPEVLFRDFFGSSKFFSFVSAFWPGLLGLVFLMKGGRKRYVATESKSFDFELVGPGEDPLRIYENGRGRRFSILLPELASQ